MYIYTLRVFTLSIYYSKTLFLCNFTHYLCFQNTSNLSSRCQQLIKRRGGWFRNQWCNITEKPDNSVHPITLQQIQTVYYSGLTHGIGSLRESSARRNIRESLLGSAGVGRCNDLSNRCMFGLSNQQAGRSIPGTELELNRFHPLTLWEFVWNLSTQVNNSNIDS